MQGFLAKLTRTPLEEAFGYQNRYIPGLEEFCVALRKVSAPPGRPGARHHVPVIKLKPFKWPALVSTVRPAESLFRNVDFSDLLHLILTYMLHMELGLYGMVKMDLTARFQWRNRLSIVRTPQQAAKLLLELEQATSSLVFNERWFEEDTLNRRKSRSGSVTMEVVDRSGGVEYAEFVKAPREGWYRHDSAQNRATMTSKRETRAAVLAAGRKRIPGMVYSRLGFAVQTLQANWRSRVSRIRTVAQLALEVRLLDTAIGWSTITKPEVLVGRKYLLEIRKTSKGLVEYLILDQADRQNPEWLPEDEVPIWMIKERDDFFLNKIDIQKAKILSKAPFPQSIALQTFHKTKFLEIEGSVKTPFIVPPIPDVEGTFDDATLAQHAAPSLHICVCGEACTSASGYISCAHCEQRYHKQCFKRDTGSIRCIRCGSTAVMRDIGRMDSDRNGKEPHPVSSVVSKKPLNAVETPQPPKPIPRRTEPRFCEVCGEQPENSNDLLSCKGCGVAVHSECYNIGRSVSNLVRSRWLCDPCSLGVESASCVLCPTVAGPLRSTNDMRFAHPICVIYSVETYFDETTAKVGGIEAIDPSRYKLRCRVCKKMGYAPPQCSLKTCGIAVHPLCAREEGLPLFEDEENGELVAKMFCAKHKDREDAKPQAVWRRKAAEVLRRITDHEESEPFREPVDVDRAGLEDYLQVIAHPMDLGTVDSKLKGSKYFSPQSMYTDVMLIWSNCRTYNTGRKRTAALLAQNARLEALFTALWKDGFPDFVPHESTPVQKDTAPPAVPLKPTPDVPARPKHDEWQAQAQQILKRLLKLSFAEPFREPVDYKGLGLDDYISVVKIPVDLGTTMAKLEDDKYRTIEALYRDIRRVFENCRAYNGSDPSCPVMVACVKCEQFLEKEWNSTFAELGNGLMFALPKTENNVRVAPPRKVSPGWYATVTKILKHVRSMQESAVFREPVDLDAYPQYVKVVKRPMDLGTVGKKLTKDSYGSAQELLADVRLVWENCRKFNGLDCRDEIVSDSYLCEDTFEKQWDEHGLKGASGPTVLKELERAGAKKNHFGCELSLLEGGAIGCVVELYSPQERKWMPGTLTKYSDWRRDYLVQYRDGYEERVSLRSEDVRLQSAPDKVWKVLGRKPPPKEATRPSRQIAQFEPRTQNARLGRSSQAKRNGNSVDTEPPTKRPRTVSDSKRLAMMGDEAIGLRVEIIAIKGTVVKFSGVIAAFNRRRSEFRVSCNITGDTKTVHPATDDVRLVSSRSTRQQRG